MPGFEPFRALRYDTTQCDLAAVTAPPYDVIDAEDRAALAARDPHNVVHLDVPVADEGRDAYANARHLLGEWRQAGVLVVDDEPGFYVYRMSFVGDDGTARSTTGVLGALELSPPGSGDVLPHEHTTPKARSDRLQMLRSCRTNLSPIWCLSVADGLTALLDPPGDPIGEWDDEDRVTHALWRIVDPDRVATIARRAGSATVLIADGHHRWETSVTYRDERRAESGGEAGAAEAALVWLVELVPDQLAVRPIHRLLDGLPPDFDVASALASHFHVEDAPRPGPHTAATLDAAGAMGLITAGGSWLLRPRSGAFAGVPDLDSSRLDAARSAWPDHEVVYQHGVDHVVRLVEAGKARAGVLLRPVGVDQIEATAHGGERMPPKSTFFHPKARTGLVFRLLD